MGDGGRKILSSTARQIIFWLLIVAGALLIYKLVNPGTKNTTPIDLTQLEQKIQPRTTVAVDGEDRLRRSRLSRARARLISCRLTNEHTKAEILKEARERGRERQIQGGRRFRKREVPAFGGRRFITCCRFF